MANPLRDPKALPLLAAAGLALVLGGLLIAQGQRVQQLVGQVRAKQQQVALLEGQAQELLQQVTDLQKDRDTLTTRLTTLQADLGHATEEAERARQTAAELEGRVTQLDAQRADLEARLGQATAERDKAQAARTQLEQDKTTLADSIKRLRNRLALLNRDYEEAATKLSQLQARPEISSSTLRIAGPPTGAAAAGPPTTHTPTAIPGTVELPPIIVRKNQAGINSRVQGRIVEVNEPRNFVVIDQGQDDGVYLGMAFDILRGATTIGRATVIRVRPQLAACDIVRVNTPGPIAIGDLAVQRGS